MDIHVGLSGPGTCSRSLPLVIVIVAVIAGCGRSGEAPPTGGTGPTAPTMPNIVLILSDTHRLDHVSALSSADPSLTPGIASLARDGVSFTEVYTPVPISAPAYASLMTGLRPVEHGLLNNQQHLGPDPPLIQERLQRLGYRTAAVVGNPFCSSGHGFGRGFDSFWDHIEGRGKEGEILTDEAVLRLESLTGEAPFFLFVAYMDAHTPYIADEIPPSLRVEVNGVRIRDERAENAHVEQRFEMVLEPGENRISLNFLDNGEPARPADGPSPLHLKGLRLASGLPLERTDSVVPIEGTPYERIDNATILTVVNPDETPVNDELVFRCYRKYRPEIIPGYYAAGVRSFDRSAGRLLDHLRERELYEDAVVIFVSDHGEMLGEHDAWGHVEHLWEESLRVPLVVKGPGLERGTASSTRLDLLDLHDLVLALASGDVSTVDRLTTPSREKTIVGATYPPESGVLQATAIRGPFKVVVDADGAERAFDLDNDRAEAVDILARAQQDPHIPALLAAARDELAAATEVESLDLSALSAEERDRLRALGYLHTDP
jgi:arylsulfatase A-like enzyme